MNKWVSCLAEVNKVLLLNLMIVTAGSVVTFFLEGQRLCSLSTISRRCSTPTISADAGPWKLPWPRFCWRRERLPSGFRKQEMDVPEVLV